LSAACRADYFEEPIKYSVEQNVLKVLFNQAEDLIVVGKQL
jgi:hypothetical protein